MAELTMRGHDGAPRAALRRAVLTLFAFTAVVVAPRPASAGVEGIVIGKDSSLFVISADGQGSPREVVALGRPASEVSSLESDLSGSVLLIGFAGSYAHAPLRADGPPSQPTPIDCAGGTARISPRGDCAICDEADGRFSLIPFAPGAKKTVRQALSKDSAFLDAHGVELAFRDDEGIWALPVRRRAKRRRLVESAPVGGLLIAPNGERAVAAYPSSTDPTSDPTLFTFALDGTGARRRLNRNGVALRWSSDGQWLLIRDGLKACLVRAVGGQYKCWKRYEGSAISPDGAFAVLRRESEQSNKTGSHDLYLGKSAGAYTESPKLLVRNVAPVATWLPEPAKQLTPPVLPPPTDDAGDDSHGEDGEDDDGDD